MEFSDAWSYLLFCRHEIQVDLFSLTDKVEWQRLCSEVPRAKQLGWVSSSSGEFTALPF